MTEPDRPREIAGTVRASAGGFALWLSVPGRGERTLFAFSEGALERPRSLRANRPSRWHEAWEGADLVIVTHGAFQEALAALQALRESEGLKTVVVDVEDLYDEWSFGAKDPKALKDFLAHAQDRWQRPPSHLLLVGDATFDPRDYLGLGDQDLMPARILETEFLETASDDWFADFDEDGVAEVAVGRLPVRTPKECEAVVSKLIAYAKAPAGDAEAWRREALFVSDDTDLFDFERSTQRLKDALPGAFTAREISLSAAGPIEARSQLLEALSSGQLLVNYFGHGSVEVWAREEILTSEDVLSLENGPRLPVVAAMNCLNGFFHDLYTESLAEVLLKAPGGGAAAVWASSGLTAPHDQAALNEAFLRHLLGEEGLSLGEAAQKAKVEVGDRDVRRTWILFGDPAMRLR